MSSGGAIVVRALAIPLHTHAPFHASHRMSALSSTVSSALGAPSHNRVAPQPTRVGAGTNSSTQSSQRHVGPSFCVGRPVVAGRAGAPAAYTTRRAVDAVDAVRSTA
eukprot:1553383-Prymnesium_polylepis.1